MLTVPGVDMYSGPFACFYIFVVRVSTISVFSSIPQLIWRLPILLTVCRINMYSDSHVFLHLVVGPQPSHDLNSRNSRYLKSSPEVFRPLDIWQVVQELSAVRKLVSGRVKLALRELYYKAGV